MGSTDAALFAVCLFSGTGWATFAAWRAPGGSVHSTARALLGGGAAFGLALGAYALLEAVGLGIRWERVLAGGGGALLTAMGIGVVEESAKLVGILLAVVGPGRPGAVMRATMGCAASFAALEAAIALSGASPIVAFPRALLAPVAHAILAAPIGFGLAAAARRPRAAVAPVALGLAVAAALHALADLSLAAPRFGQLGYAAVLLAPALAIYLHARRPGPAAIPHA